MVILALGYQLHFSINSAPFFLRFAKPADLEWLMPVFWIGFNIAMFPASVVVKHRGGLIVMGAAGLLGAVAVVGAEMAGSLNMLIAAQFLAGAAWGCMLMSAVSAALAIGETGAEGKVVGLVFSALALATFARMAAVAGGLQKLPDYAPLLHWAPVACWSVRRRAAAGTSLVLAASAEDAALRLRRMDERPGAGFGAGRHFDVDQIRPAMRQRLFQRAAESVRRGYARGADAEGFCELDEIRIDQVGRHHAAIETLDLVAPHIAVGIVVEHQRHHSRC